MNCFEIELVFVKKVFSEQTTLQAKHMKENASQKMRRFFLTES